MVSFDSTPIPSEFHKVWHQNLQWLMMYTFSVLGLVQINTSGIILAHPLESLHAADRIIKQRTRLDIIQPWIELFEEGIAMMKEVVLINTIWIASEDAILGTPSIPKRKDSYFMMVGKKQPWHDITWWWYVCTYIYILYYIDILYVFTYPATAIHQWSHILKYSPTRLDTEASI